MAIIFSGKSTCSICNQILKEDDEIFSFTAFTANTKDPMWFFSDAAFHKHCLAAHPSGIKAIDLANQAFLKTRYENRICAVTNRHIDNPDDCIFISLLTSNIQEPLYQFNFTNLNKKHLPHWKEKEKFIKAVEQFETEGKWGHHLSYNYIKNLIERLQE